MYENESITTYTKNIKNAIENFFPNKFKNFKEMKKIF